MSHQRQAKHRANPRLKNHAVYKKLRTRWAKRNHLNELEMFNTKQYRAKSFMKPLELASTANMSISTACTCYRVAGHDVVSAELLLKQCRDERWEDMEIHVNHALEEQFRGLPAAIRREFRRRGVVIVDFHDDPYYGSRDNPFTVPIARRKGTTRAYSYMTADLWSPRGTVTVAVRPRHRSESTADMFWDLWARVNFILRPKLLLMDGEFAIVDILDGLQKNDVPFIARMPITYRVRPFAVAYELTDNWERLRKFHQLKIRDKPRRKEITITITFHHTPKGMKGLVLAPCLVTTPIKVEELYRKRFSIETGYRDKHLFQARTSTNNLSIRLLLHVMAVMLWNIWRVFTMALKSTSKKKIPRFKHYRLQLRVVKLFLLVNDLLTPADPFSRR